MKVLLTGAAGQLGQALIASQPAGVDLIATSRAELDLADGAACRAAVQHHPGFPRRREQPASVHSLHRTTQQSNMPTNLPKGSHDHRPQS